MTLPSTDRRKPRLIRQYKRGAKKAFIIKNGSGVGSAELLPQANKEAQQCIGVFVSWLRW
jgi:hypothetical protein